MSEKFVFIQPMVGLPGAVSSAPHDHTGTVHGTPAGSSRPATSHAATLVRPVATPLCAVMAVAPFIARTIQRPLVLVLVDTSRSTTSSLPSPFRSPNPANAQSRLVERSVAASPLSRVRPFSGYQCQVPEVLRRRASSLPSPFRSAKPASPHAAPVGRVTAPLPVPSASPSIG